MYGLAYCKLDYDYMYNLDLDVLYALILAELDKQARDYDADMTKLAWQTAALMNASGNYKREIKPESLYKSVADTKMEELEESERKANIQKMKDELLATFNLSE